MKIIYKLLTNVLICATAFSISLFSTKETVKKETAKTDTPTSEPLYHEIAHMDSLMFDAFNSRNLDRIDRLKQFFDPGL